VTARLAGGALMALGATLGVLPAFTWFLTPPDASPVHLSGFRGAGQLWLLPVLGLLIVLAGATLASSPPGRAQRTARWTGPLAFVAALTAAAFSVWAGTDPAVTLHVALPTGTEVVPATVSLAPAAIVAPIAAGVAAAIGAAVAVAGRRR